VRYIGTDRIPPIHKPLDPDDITDFHAARLLILLSICGEGKSRVIEGRTKATKLDFFLRYPTFLEKAQRVLADRGEPHSVFAARGQAVESPMIRYRYGPWDPRYRTYIQFLESRGLIRVYGEAVERVALTSKGINAAKVFVELDAFAPLVRRAQAMVGNLASWRGTRLKDFVYDVLVAEVAELSLGTQISP
jgi:hypothetical protein